MSTPAGLYNIIADQGSTFSRTILWRDPAKKPILMQGYKARMQVRTSVDSPDTVLELTTENNGISLHATNGNITLFVSDDDMVEIPENKYVYDLELIAPSSSLYVYKLLTGNFVVRAEVTR
jgi:hypothetical protein